MAGSTVTVKPKAPRGQLHKKATPKSKAAAQRLNQTLVAGVNGRPSETSTSLPDGIVALDPHARAAAEAPAQPPKVDLGEIKELRVDWLARHPRNRRPDGELVIRRAASMGTEGQLEPIIVRVWDGGPDGTRFQILSGETRWLAAQMLKWKTIAGRVVEGDCDDARALDLLALYNGQRADLNPIEKARLIEDLHKAGRTREQAAIEVGLQSGSAASNLVRLLELPQVWQDRVASGDLPESFARLLVPLAKVPRLFAELEKPWSEHQKANDSESKMDVDCYEDDFGNREALAKKVADLIEEETRPVEAGIVFDYPWSIESKHGLNNLPWEKRKQPILFELTDELREKLQIVEFTMVQGQGKKAKSVLQQRATNVQLWDELQIPLIKKLIKTLATKGANKSADADEKKAAKKKALTPAQQREKDKERAAQLKARIDAWRHRWLCTIAAERIWSHHEALLAFSAYMLAEQDWPSYGLAEAAFGELDLKAKDHFDYADFLFHQLYGRRTIGNHANDTFRSALYAMARYALLKEDSNPKYPRLGKIIDDLASWLQIDLETEWHALKQDPEHLQLVTFLALHNSDQLDALGKELNVFVEGQKGKANKMQAIETAPRSLPMPKAIRRLPTAAVAKASIKKPAAKKRAL